eukprot:1159806-Pelagomonas_calceolata.AAC.7
MWARASTYVGEAEAVARHEPVHASFLRAVLRTCAFTQFCTGHASMQANKRAHTVNGGVACFLVRLCVIHTCLHCIAAENCAEGSRASARANKRARTTRGGYALMARLEEEEEAEEDSWEQPDDEEEDQAWCVWVCGFVCVGVNVGVGVGVEGMVLGWSAGCVAVAVRDMVGKSRTVQKCVHEVQFYQKASCAEGRAGAMLPCASSAVLHSLLLELRREGT